MARNWDEDLSSGVAFHTWHSSCPAAVASSITLLDPANQPKFINSLPIPAVIDATKGGTFAVNIGETKQWLGLVGANGKQRSRPRFGATVVPTVRSAILARPSLRNAGILSRSLGKITYHRPGSCCRLTPASCTPRRRKKVLSRWSPIFTVDIPHRVPMGFPMRGTRRTSKKRGLRSVRPWIPTTMTSHPRRSGITTTRWVIHVSTCTLDWQAFTCCVTRTRTIWSPRACCPAVNTKSAPRSRIEHSPRMDSFISRPSPAIRSPARRTR